jgi:hypothetical protein
MLERSATPDAALDTEAQAAPLERGCTEIVAETNCLPRPWVKASSAPQSALGKAGSPKGAGLPDLFLYPRSSAPAQIPLELPR